MKKIIVCIALLISVLACKKSGSFPETDSVNTEYADAQRKLTKEQFKDKFLGLLVGGAIGDAMGAPTEMWHHDYITEQVGWVTDLDVHQRTASAEGPWVTNGQAGSTTDDTRWKYFATKYFLENAKPTPKAFAQYFIKTYQGFVNELKSDNNTKPDQIDRHVLHTNWIQEWVKVAEPFVANKMEDFAEALSQFYGGEMVCGGMLYAPVFGGMYAETPQLAYQKTFEHSIFDMGYARDITGLTAAFTAEAMKPNSHIDSVLRVSLVVDPKGFSNARLVGRTAYRLSTDAKHIMADALKIKDANPELSVPIHFKGTALEYTQIRKMFELLDAKAQDMPFHAGEIHLINLVALEYGQGDFAKTMEFVINYGRDNDTVGAVTGSILGAHLGFKKLPKHMADRVLQENLKTQHIDLEALATDVTEMLY